MLPPLNGPLQQPARLPTEPYDHQKTYIAIIASDGDNMQVEPLLAHDKAWVQSQRTPRSHQACVRCSNQMSLLGSC